MTPAAVHRQVMQLAREQRLAEALALLNEALRTLTDVMQAREVAWLCRTAAMLCTSLGRLRDAAGYYEEAVRATPDDPYIHSALGDTYAALGDEVLSTLHRGHFERLAGASADPAVQQVLAAYLALKRGKS